MHIEFDMDGSKMRYESGDHLAVYPVNCSELVEKIGVKCSTDLDTVFTLTNTDGITTIVALIKHDINLYIILQRNLVKNILSLVLAHIERH